jgi:NCS1 nucleoside transporter family
MYPVSPPPSPAISASPDHQDVEMATRQREFGRLKRLGRWMRQCNLEVRGIERVIPADRYSLAELGFVQVGTLWFSVNLTANNIILGMLGPAIYRLSFVDASLCAVLGMSVGVLPVAYISTFGPLTGLRTMVFARFSMGWYPAKILVALNIVTLLGYSLVTAVVAGQIVSAVSGAETLSVVVGIVIVAVITWTITTLGYRTFHVYERYAWIPQTVVLSILAGVAGPKFDLTIDPSWHVDTTTANGDRLSFFSLCLAAAITYGGGAADVFVYYPESSPPHKVFAATALGLVVSFTGSLIIGVGLGSGIARDRAWGESFAVSEGALIVEAFRPLGGFGSFCAIVVALGLVSNMILPIYTAGVSFQTFGKQFEKVPRVVWNTAGVAVFTVCAVVGRSDLAEIFTNLLALMGYWVSTWIAILLEEHIIFRKWMQVGWDWQSWNDPQKLPLGLAACLAFLAGWAGSVLCMAQIWYIGPLASLVGKQGGDMGNYAGFVLAGIVFPPLRWFEMRRCGR